MRLTFIGPVPPLRSGIAQHGGYLATALAETPGTEVTVLSWQHQYPKRLFPRAQVDPDARPHPGARFVLRWWDPISWWRAGRMTAGSDIVVLTWTTPFHALPYRLIMAMARRGPARRLAGRRARRSGGRAGLAAGPGTPAAGSAATAGSQAAGSPADSSPSTGSDGSDVRGSTIVAMVHNAVPHESLPLQVPLTRWVLRRCDGAVVHARAIADELAELVGPIRTAVTPMPAHIPVEPRPLPDSDEVRLLFFGFIRPYKGLDIALDALAILRDKGLRYRLSVVGELWDPDDTWEERVAERGLTDQVDLRHEYVPDEKVGEVMAAHHAVILPYRSASQSGIVPVALESGRPVVATAVGGLVEVVTDGVNGTVARPEDAESLADAIARCIDDLPALSARARDGAPRWSDTAAALYEAAGLHTKP